MMRDPLRPALSTNISFMSMCVTAESCPNSDIIGEMLDCDFPRPPKTEKADELDAKLSTSSHTEMEESAEPAQMNVCLCLVSLHVDRHVILLL